MSKGSANCGSLVFPRKARKGIAGTLVTIILGLLVILLIVWGPVRVGVEYAKVKFFGERGVFGSGDKDKKFEPFVPRLYGEFAVVDNSMKALICATKITAAGRVNYFEFCPDADNIKGLASEATLAESAKQSVTGGFLTALAASPQKQKMLDQAIYGSTMVKCSGGGVSKELSDSESDDLKILVGETLKCWKILEGGQKDVVCGQFIIPSTFPGTLTEDKFVSVLEKSGSLGKDIAGTGGLFGSAPDNYLWKIPDKIDKNSGPFFICGTFTGTDKIVLTQTPFDDCPGADVGANCEVKKFELPQEITKAEEWIRGRGDPEHLAYFEKFPEGERKTWQTESKDFVMAGLAVQTGLTAITTLVPLVKPVKWVKEGAGAFFARRAIAKAERLAQEAALATNEAQRVKKLKKLASVLDKLEKKGVLDEGLRTLTKLALKGPAALPAEEAAKETVFALFKDFAQIVNDPELKSLSKEQIQMLTEVILTDGLQDFGSRYSTEFTEQEIKTFASRLAPKLKTGLDNPFAWQKEIYDTVGEELEKRAGKKYAEDFTRIATAEKLAAKGITRETAQVMARLGFKNTINAILRQGSAEKALLKGDTIMRSLKTADPAKYKQLLEETDNLLTGVIDENGLINFNRLLKQSQEAEALMDALFKADQNVISGLRVEVTGFKDLASGSKWMQALPAGTATALGLGAVEGRTAGEIFKEIAKNQIRGIGCIPAGRAVRWTRFGSSYASNCAVFLRSHFIPFMAALGLFAQYTDSMDKPLRPVGTGQFALFSPYDELPSTYDVQGVENLYVQLSKEDGIETRFHAVSPCKTDYYTEKLFQKCSVDNGDYIYPTSHGSSFYFQPVEPFFAAKPEYLKLKSMWDVLSPEGRSVLLWQGSKPLWGEKLPFYEGNVDIVKKTILTGGIRGRSYLGGIIQPEFYTITGRIPLFFADGLLNALMIVAPDSKTFYETFSYYALKKGEAQLNDKLKKILKLNDEQYASFLEELVDVISNPETEDYLPDFYHPPKDLGVIDFTGEEMARLARYFKFFFDDAGLGEPTLFDTAQLTGFGSIRNTLGCEVRENCIEVFKFKDANDYDTAKINWNKLESKQYTITDRNEEVNKAWHNALLSIQQYKLLKSNYFDSLMRQQAYHIIEYQGPQPNVPIVKKCNTEKQELGPRLAPDESKLGNFIAVKTSVETVNVRPDMEPYGYVNNYCYSAKNPVLQFAETGLTYVSLAAGVATLPLAPTGVWGAAAYGVSFSADLALLGTTYVMELCGNWPNHEANLLVCTGLASSSGTATPTAESQATSSTTTSPSSLAMSETQQFTSAPLDTPRLKN